MFIKNDLPVLEFDNNPTAKLNPTNFAQDKFKTNKMIITFFPEVVEKLVKNGQIIEEQRISGENPFIVYRFAEHPDVLLTLGQFGCPSCAGNLDEFHAMGITKVMFRGGGGA